MELERSVLAYRTFRLRGKASLWHEPINKNKGCVSCL